MSEFLMKSCASEHNVIRCEAIQLGSLGLYRGEANTEVGDPREGKHTISYNISSCFADNYALNIINPYVFGFGEKQKGVVDRAHRSAVNMEVSAQTRFGANVSVTGEFDYTGTDALLFCCSKVSSLDKAPRLGYNDRWFMRFENANAFASRLESALNGDLKEWPPEDFTMPERYFTPDGYKTPQLRFKVFHGPVSYDGSSINLTSLELHSMMVLKSRFSTPELHKDHGYKHQDEYRFVALLQANIELIDGGLEQRAVSFKRQRTFLRSEAFREFVVET